MNIESMRSDPAVFRQHLIIDVGGSARPLGECIEPWQARDFHSLDNGFCRAVGRPVDETAPTYQRAYLERSRGHSKTSDLAVMVLWALLGANHAIRGIAAAADRDQAKLLRDAIWRLCRLNPWLVQSVTDPDTGKQAALIDCQQYKVRNTLTGSEVVIISADAASAWGHLCELIIVDELSIHPKRDLWDAIISTAPKRRNCMVVCISNSGWLDSWQWPIREHARESAEWYFSRTDGVVASWITPGSLAELRKLLPPSSYTRTIDNEWVDGSGDGIPSEAIDDAVDDTLEPIVTWWPTHVNYRQLYSTSRFIGGIDLSTKRDHSAAVIFRVVDGEIRLAWCRSWAPRPVLGVDLGAIRSEIIDVSRGFGRVAWHADPHQAHLLISDCRKAGLDVREMQFVGQSLDLMATCVLSAFQDRQVKLYREGQGQELIRDFRRLTITERSFGFKLEAPRTGGSHADLAFAAACAIPACVDAITEAPTGPVSRFWGREQPGNWSMGRPKAKPEQFRGMRVPYTTFTPGPDYRG